MKIQIQPGERKFSIDWKDGAVLHFNVKYVHEIALEFPNKSQTFQLNMMILKSLVGWDGIVDQEGKAVPFSKEIAKLIFDLILMDEPFLMKVMVAIGGPLGNLAAGLTSTSITGGITENAASASENTKEKPSPASGEPEEEKEKENVSL